MRLNEIAVFEQGTLAERLIFSRLIIRISAGNRATGRRCCNTKNRSLPRLVASFRVAIELVTVTIHIAQVAGGALGKMRLRILCTSYRAMVGTSCR